MRRVLILFIVLMYCHSNAQNGTNISGSDNRYLEDQFYVGVTYNFLMNKPQDVSQRNLSYGLQGGFIKDIPLNRSRNFGIGVGLGYGVNSYYSNIIGSETSEGLRYALITDDLDVKRSKTENHLIELPLELRWRGSNATDYKFWRIYAGLKLGYAFSSRTKVVGSENKYSFSNPDVREFQSGLTLNIGYNTFNVHFYYALNTLFSADVYLNGEEMVSKPLRIGLIFYIL